MKSFNAKMKEAISVGKAMGYVIGSREGFGVLESRKLDAITNFQKKHKGSNITFNHKVVYLIDLYLRIKGEVSVGEFEVLLDRLEVKYSIIKEITGKIDSKNVSYPKAIVIAMMFTGLNDVFAEVKTLENSIGTDEDVKAFNDSLVEDVMLHDYRS